MGETHLSAFCRRLPVLLAALLALFAAPLAAQPQTKAAQTAAAVTHAKPAIWVVKDKDTTIYLFGTIHMLRPGIQWFEGPVKRAFDSSNELVLEIADEADAATQVRIVQRAMDTTGPTLTEKLPEAMRAKFTELLTQYQLPIAAIDRMKPWFAAITLTSAPLQKLGYDASQGVEVELRKQAEAQGKTILGLETTDEQIGFFENLSNEMQIALLVETINEQSDVETTLARMIDAWSAGDPARLAETLNKSMDDDKELEQKLLFDRNKHWADWIKARLDKPGTVFLAVGAGHLAGKGSVLEELRARHVKARRVEPR